MNIRTITVGNMGEQCYLLIDDNHDAVMVDPGDDANILLHELEAADATLKAILITHGHFDHIAAVEEIREKTGAKVIAHKEGKRYLTDPTYNLSNMIGKNISFEADMYVSANEEIKLNDSELTFKVLYVPGHTSDGVAFYHAATATLFAGDIIFRNSVGRTDLPGSNTLQLLEGIKSKIFKLPDATLIYPGHGLRTTVGFEKKNNTFVK
ncbi:MBL fold metallo-hydrolase [Candidatus Epulonipiscium viviparus]|uniref:MBL fold metallo-hydrolase n=1 Tax=Candidatus Epulonipiscium viviparus TaxID=420336 RepID=UPI00016C0A2A|nr:MBL fold metallo-hydrolase [Candidatus Epulopiscium viviparus]